MANPVHLEILLQGAPAWQLWRAMHPEIVPDLSGADLARLDLGNSDLIGVNFSGANLRRARLDGCNLAGARLSGTDLTGARLPEALARQLDNLSSVKEISSNAQKLFIVVLAACLYSWLTVASTTDVNLVTNRATSSLPIIQTSIPIVGFFYAAPLLLLAAYLYLHFYLQKLWEQLGALPAVFCDGQPLYEKTDPWLLSDLVRVHGIRFRERVSFLLRFQTAVSVLLTWGLAPLTLLMLWGRYLVRHELAGAAFHLIICTVAITSSVFLYRLAVRTLRGAEAARFRWRLASAWVPLLTGVLIAMLLGAVSLGAIEGARSGNLADNYWPDQTGPRSWIPKGLSLMTYIPFADLRAAELSQKSSDPASAGNAGTQAKGIPLGGVDLRFADMRAAFLRNSILTDADLRDADLLGADLQQAGMIGADLRGASLANADLRNASLVRTRLDGADLKYAHLEGALGLTPDQVRVADNWCEAFYDPAQLARLELPPGNNDQVTTWLLFDRDNSSQASPTTPEAAREADLRRFSLLPDLQVQAPVAPALPGAETPATASIRTVRDLARIYNFPTNLDGSGQTIGLIELGGGYNDSDLDQYFRNIGLKKPHVTFVPVDGVSNLPSRLGGDYEVESNIEIVGAVAPGADIVVYFTSPDAKGYADAIRTALDDKIHHLTVLGTGWGSPEGDKLWRADDMKKIDSLLAEAAKRNITVVAAAGDHGARDAATEKRLRVDFPASSPWVLAVGGTRLVSNGQSGHSEVAWNDGENGGASGGGASDVFERPKWQSVIRVPHGLSARLGRGLPDVAINASANSGYALVVDGQAVQIGGTGTAATMWAGLIALLNQGLGRNVGYINPLLYEKLGPRGIMRSVVNGHNGIGELSGYCAGPGWNAATGWGSPDGMRLLHALKSLNP
jgi:uncharacterized protein YjbI with pentapeptide repeats